MLIIHFFLSILLRFFTKLPLKLHFGYLILVFLLHFFAIFEGLKSQNSLKNDFFR